MADNVDVLNALGFPVTISTKEVGPAQVCRVQVQHGAAGVATDASETNPLPVKTCRPLTPAAPTAASVGVTSAVHVAMNATRKGLVLVNTSNGRISLAFDAAAVLDAGITLYPGGVFAMEDPWFTTGAVSAIAQLAGSNLAVQEYN